MAQLAPFGFQVGQSRRSVNEYYVASSDTSTLAVGDPVKTNGNVFVGRLPDSRQSSGMLHVTKAASGDSIRGVIVGIAAGPGDNSAQSIPGTKQRAYTVLVNDNPQALWDVQADNTAPLSAMAGMYAAYTVGAPLGSVSSTVVNSSSIGATVNDLLIAEVLRNDGANSLLRVAFVQHEMAAAGGSPQIGAQIQSLVSGGGIPSRYTGVGAGYDVMAGTMTAANATAGSQTGATPETVTDVVTEAGPGVQITTASAAGEWAQLTWALPTAMTIRQIAALLHVPTTTQSAVALYASTDGTFGGSTMVSKTITVSANSGMNGHQTNGLLMPYMFGGEVSNAWTNSGTLNLNTALFTHVRVRVTPLAGQFADLTVVKLLANPSRRSRIYITSDDGYLSWYVYALPLLQARGLVSSVAVIPPLVGSASYMNLSQLREFVAAGHECITHGPQDGNGSLIDNYATNAERVADMVAQRQWITDNGLFTRDAQKRCYIWPQGKFQAAASDQSLIEAAQAAGFTVARSVSRFVPFSEAAAGMTPAGQMILPIIGHSRQTSEVNENAEITNITNAISYAAANGLDACLMFHKVIADQAVFSATEAIEIEVSRLATIFDAIVTQIGAGKMECGLLSDMAR